MTGYNWDMDLWLPAFVDELEKIAVSKKHSTYGAQARRGRRPIRVAKMLEKDNEFWSKRLRGKPGEENWRNPENREDDDAKFYEHEGYRQNSTTPESGDDGAGRGRS